MISFVAFNLEVMVAEASSRLRATGSPKLPLTLAMENIRTFSLSHVTALLLPESRLLVYLGLWRKTLCSREVETKL
ncbi:hypothetical protein V6N13_061398 [Hibiscus sabdariffa]|uniref:Uncharacterized protein n=1 Tax=Hibiscus sabdariffa TaxID=183260 RepID=A0ABR2EGX7_9ROSI